VTSFDALAEDGRPVLSQGALHLDRP
jgi:hypothetical protein